MANALQAHEGENFKEGVSTEKPAFFIEGAESLDWGMKNRLARIFNPKSRKTSMMAIDHG
jgi:putative autoinducer-2 (AI-2) aldolase